MSKPPLIAVVATALIVDGQRVVIPAGQPLPALQDKDRDELLAAKAAREPASQAGLAQPAAPTAQAADAAPAPKPSAKPAAKKA